MLQRRGEVRPLGHGIASPGRLEDRVGKPGTVAELLDQTRLAHPAPARHDHSLTTGGARTANHQTQLPSQLIQVRRPALELHRSSSPIP